MPQFKVRAQLLAGIAAFVVNGEPTFANTVGAEIATDISNISTSAIGRPTDEAPPASGNLTSDAQPVERPSDSGRLNEDIGGLEDIVVSARKTTELNQKAPATIVAINSETLLERGIVDGVALEKVLPSATLRRQGPVTQIFIRGVGSNNDNANFSPPSAFLYNGVILPRFGSFGLTYDLGSVEMIAGPQGTLYGGSAAGGAINLQSQRPTGNITGRADIELRNYDMAHFTVASDLIASDKVGLRASFDYLKRGSFYSNGLYTQDGYNVKLGALLTPSDNVSAYIFFAHGHEKGLSVTSFVQIPLRDPDHPWRLPAVGGAGQVIDPSLTKQNNTNDILGANIDIDIGENHFTYIPAYVSFTVDYSQYSGFRANLFDIYDSERQHSQELRWNRRFGALQMSAGLFYLRNHVISGPLALNLFTSPTTSTRRLILDVDQVNKSYAVFAQGIYSLSDKFRLTLGGRVTRDRIDVTGVGATPNAIDFHHAETHKDYKIGVDYDLTDRILLYANLQSGYIPFGYSPDVVPTEVIPTSELTAWSAGFKSRFFNNRLEINTELFYYIYRKFQAVQFITQTAETTVLNAEKSTIPGIDIAIRARPTDTWNINLSAVFMKARYTNFRGVGYDFSGNHMINAPDFNIIAGIEKTIPLDSEGSQLRFRVDTHFQGPRYTAFNAFPFAYQGPGTKTDFLASYEPNDWLSVEAFVRNIENRAVITGGNPGTTPTTPVGTGLEMPRTYGGRISVKW